MAKKARIVAMPYKITAGKVFLNSFFRSFILMVPSTRELLKKTYHTIRKKLNPTMNISPAYMPTAIGIYGCCPMRFVAKGMSIVQKSKKLLSHRSFQSLFWQLWKKW